MHASEKFLGQTATNVELDVGHEVDHLAAEPEGREPDSAVDSEYLGWDDDDGITELTPNVESDHEFDPLDMPPSRANTVRAAPAAPTKRPRRWRTGEGSGGDGWRGR